MDMSGLPAAIAWRMLRARRRDAVLRPPSRRLPVLPLSACDGLAPANIDIADRTRALGQTFL